MGKIKSAIITAFLVAAIIILALFATVSCNVPGSQGVKRYNSFISNIKLGADLSGEAYALLYPEGVISTADYELVVGDSESPDKADYENKYLPCGGIYVLKDKLGYNLDIATGEYTKADNADETERKFKESIAQDAKILSKRFGEKGYTGYSVSVEDGFSIKISVPTSFTYAAYRENDSTKRSESLSEISHTVQYLMLSGALGLRDGAEYEDSSSIIPVKDDLKSYFKNISFYSVAGNYAVRMTLTDEGFETMNAVLTAGEESGKAYFYVGETSLGLSLDTGTALEEKTLFYSATKSYAQDFAILIGSVHAGETLNNVYNDDSANSGTSIIATSPVFGEFAAVYLLAVMLLVLVGAIVFFIIKYKKLGLVNAIMVCIYTLAMVLSLMLIGIELTITGAFTLLLGLALLEFTNIIVFERIRKETQNGRTLQASVKLGYKKTFTTVLDLHIILLAVALMITLICVGEASACGFIFFIATIASYVLYWFTRFMWFVISSPARDKFKFCGFKREVLEDED